AFVLLRDDLAQHARGAQAGKAGQVDRCLGVAGAAQHAPLLGAQRNHVTGGVEVVGGGIRVGQQADGVRPVGRGDTGGHALPRVHGHGVGGAALVLVLVVHRRQVEPVGVRLGQRHADVAGGVPDHEGQQFGCGLLGREDQIALVLPVLVVDDDHELARGDVRDGPLDRRETFLRRLAVHGLPVDLSTLCAGHCTSPARPISLSTYFASTSTSMFTGSPGTRPPRMVISKVVGINATLNSAGSPPSPGSVTETTVSDTPSTAMEPFSTTYRCSPAGKVNRVTPDGSRSTNVPTPSTCPCTMCPPSRSPTAAARSRFTH